MIEIQIHENKLMIFKFIHEKIKVKMIFRDKKKENHDHIFQL